MKACVPKENVPIVETINEWYETDQYIKKEERKKLEKLKAAVRFSFVSILPLGMAGFILYAQMDKKKAELVRISLSPCLVVARFCDSYDIGGAAKAA
jgi:hypothetical protein